jgi:invasion protein IalB
MTAVVQSAPVRRALGMAAVTSLVAVLAVPTALAQQPAPAPAPAQAPKAAPAPVPKAAAPKAAPKQQPAQQQGQAAPGGDQQMPVVYSPWTKICGKDQQAGAKQVCLTVKEAHLDTGQFLAGAALIEQEGEQRKIFRITLPLGMQIPQGARVIVDQDQPVNGPYMVCLPNGCMADFEVQPDFVGKLKKGQQLTIQGINLPGQAASYPIPLGDFAKVNEGPPTDPKAYEETQRKMQEELQKKRQNAPGSGAPAPAR